MDRVPLFLCFHFVLQCAASISVRFGRESTKEVVASVLSPNESGTDQQQSGPSVPAQSLLPAAFNRFVNKQIFVVDLSKIRMRGQEGRCLLSIPLWSSSYSMIPYPVLFPFVDGPIRTLWWSPSSGSGSIHDGL